MIAKYEHKVLIPKQLTFANGVVKSSILNNLICSGSDKEKSHSRHWVRTKVKMKRP